MLGDELVFTAAWQLREWIGTGRLSPVELVELYLRRIEALDPRLNAFLTVCAEEAMDAAMKDAKSGDVVILMPGCASAEPFANFRERGDAFRARAKEWVGS